MFSLRRGLDAQPLDGALVEGFLEQQLAGLRVDPHLARDEVRGYWSDDIHPLVIETSKHPKTTSSLSFNKLETNYNRAFLNVQFPCSWKSLFFLYFNLYFRRMCE